MNKKKYDKPCNDLFSSQMVFGNCGVLSSSSMIDGKGYVEMTSIDAETSQDIATSIIQKGGRFLEAQVRFK